MTRSRFSDDRGSSPRDPGPSSRPATVRRSFFRATLPRLLDVVGVVLVVVVAGPAWGLVLGLAVALVLDWPGPRPADVLAGFADRVVPSEAVGFDGLDGSRVELDRARVRGELPVELLSFGPALDGLGEISIADEEGLVDDELDPYPRPPFVDGVFVGHDHKALRDLDEGRRVVLRALARDGFAPVVLGDGSCLRCGALRFDRSGWPVPAGLVFEGFAPGRPMCEGCALRTAVGFGDDVWLADELVVESAPVEGKLRIRPTEIVVVPAGEVAARIEEGRR